MKKIAGSIAAILTENTVFSANRMDALIVNSL
jgi:hypothetical protein